MGVLITHLTAITENKRKYVIPPKERFTMTPLARLDCEPRTTFSCEVFTY